MFERTITVGNVAARLPQAIPYFKELDIDFCCGGNRVLAEVLAEKSLDEETVFSHLEAIRSALGAKNGGADFNAMSLRDLGDYIVNTHHAYLRENLPALSDLSAAVLRAHGERHRELFELASLFGSLRADLEQHILKEEMIVFPELERAANNTGSAAGADEKLLAEIIGEHEKAGGILARLRLITGNYVPPADACRSYEKLCRDLEALEDDLHRHIHLENNILFKKVLTNPAA